MSIHWENWDSNPGTFGLKAWFICKDTWYFSKETGKWYKVTYNLVPGFEKEIRSYELC